ncbi:hypothetical protein WOLCODRAFT_139965 [Wolfiporia cocos MD-104 SS10]|uniref:Uncharacterized protein n=1 Tax=Wolfiporia cocos (strain MD-104) TaxID=742152 RepID=A0A2H3JD28_WOLCO|nr:hypothetical protein WOLCODRAFT_139965 [Wolfiporia cocos MD-104 SS10]
MGGASSKPARQFPKTAAKPPPTWAGARTPSPAEARPPRASNPRASETRDAAIDRDSRDPQFMANLSRLGPVKVDHHMQTIRPAADRAHQGFQSRLRSEEEARSSRPTRNRLMAASLSDLLQEYKMVSSAEELKNLADRYDIDVETLRNVARFVSSPNIDRETVVRVVDEESGTEKITMKAAWVDPRLP